MTKIRENRNAHSLKAILNQFGKSGMALASRRFKIGFAPRTNLQYLRYRLTNTSGEAIGTRGNLYEAGEAESSRAVAMRMKAQDCEVG